MRQEFAAVHVGSEGEAQLNPELFSEWLKTQAPEGTIGSARPPEEAKQAAVRASKCLDQRLAAVSNLDLHPETRLLLGAGWSE
mgnify:CR=1 FL=1